MTTHMKQVVETEAYDVTIAERELTRGVWDVEAIDTDGGVEQAIFLGPKAEERAREYASRRYGG